MKDHIFITLARNCKSLSKYLNSQKFFIQALQNIDYNDSKKKHSNNFEEAFLLIQFIEKMIKNNELSQQEVKMFYEENMKIGIPIVHDRGTDIILQSDFYYYNFIYKSDKLYETKRGLQNVIKLQT